MPAGLPWETVLRGSVSHSLSQRGCPRGWTVAHFRGLTRLNISATAAGGRRRQLLLPIPWQADQVDTIRDAVLAIYEGSRTGRSPESTIAVISAERRGETAGRDEEGTDPHPHPSARGIDWPGLVARYRDHKLHSGEIKASTWDRLYRPRMEAMLKAFTALPAPSNGRQLLDAQARLWPERPGCRTRRMQVQYVAAFLRWAVNIDLCPTEWLPPTELSPFIGRSRGGQTITTPLMVEHILAMVDAIPDPRWRLAFQLMSAYGLRPEELQHLEVRGSRLWCTYEKVASRGKTKPRALRLLPCDTWAGDWDLEASFDPSCLPPMRPGFGSDSMNRYLQRRPLWQDLRRRYEAQGERLVLYSCRHGYAHRAHVICDLPPKVVAAAMGHSLQTHLAAYSRWCSDDVVDDAFNKAARRLEDRSEA